jgi:heat shock protein beta
MRFSLLAVAAVGIFNHVSCKEETKKASAEVAAPAFTDEIFDLASNTESKGEHFEYQAQTSRLMNLIVHSMYVNPEVFIRELLANGCDAIDKLRRASFGKADLAAEISREAKVMVRMDKEAGTITFTDNGVGMSKAELKEYLGTIAKSGTAETLAKIQESKDASSLIGQFGVGFYSAFLVANQVAVASKSDQDPKQHLWISNADSGDYTILEDPRGSTLKRGTEIVLKLKPEHSKFLDQDEVRKAMETYASFYPYPIYLEVTTTVSEEVEVDADETAEKKEDENEATVEDASSEKPTKKVVEKTVKEAVQVNSNKPLWMRDPKDCTPQDYTDLFKTMFKESDEPLTQIHFKAEGDVDFRGLVYIPKKAANFGFNSKEQPRATVQLYVRRAFITDKVDDFLPTFLSFVKVVVDSDDLSLNISRESLQNNSVLRTIKAKVLSKVFEAIKKLSTGDKKKYKQFFDSYGYALKLELANDDRYKSKIAPLLRYQSSKSAGELVALDEYIERKREGQKSIYYLAGSGVEEIEKSPFLEKLKAGDFEVLYMTDPVDEHTIRSLAKYEDFEFQNAASDGLKLPGESEEDSKKLADEFDPLLKFVQKVLPEDVEKATLSSRLVQSPCAVVASQFGWTGNMERVIMAQASAKDNPMLSFFSTQKKIFEINPNHELIKKLLKSVKKNGRSKAARDVVFMLFDSSLVQSGYTLKNHKRFSDNIERLGLSSLAASSSNDESFEEDTKKETAKSEEKLTDYEDDKDEL